MNSDDSTDVVQDDGNPMNFPNCEQTAASYEFQMLEQPLKHRLTNVNEQTKLTKCFRKVSLSNPVMNQVSPVESVDLIDKRKIDWIIQHMTRMLNFRNFTTRG